MPQIECHPVTHDWVKGNFAQYEKQLKTSLASASHLGRSKKIAHVKARWRTVDVQGVDCFHTFQQNEASLRWID